METQQPMNVKKNSTRQILRRPPLKSSTAQARHWKKSARKSLVEFVYDAILNTPDKGTRTREETRNPYLHPDYEMHIPTTIAARKGLTWRKETEKGKSTCEGIIFAFSPSPNHLTLVPQTIFTCNRNWLEKLGLRRTRSRPFYSWKHRLYHRGHTHNQCSARIYFQLYPTGRVLTPQKWAFIIHMEKGWCPSVINPNMCIDKLVISLVGINIKTCFSLDGHCIIDIKKGDACQT